MAEPTPTQDLPSDEGGTALDRIAARIEGMRQEIAAIRDRVELFGRALQIRDAALALGAIAPGAAPGPAATARPDMETAGLPRRFEAEAAEMLRSADGFHALEWGRAGAFRWTGPGHDARFEAWIDRTAKLKAVLTLAQIGDAANETALELLVDGVAYPLRRAPNENGFTTGPIAPRASTNSRTAGATGKSPASPVLADSRASGVPADSRASAAPDNSRASGVPDTSRASGATEIRLRVPHLHWPARAGGLDQRTLGVAFQRLVIGPA